CRAHYNFVRFTAKARFPHSRIQKVVNEDGRQSLPDSTKVAIRAFSAGVSATSAAPSDRRFRTQKMRPIAPKISTAGGKPQSNKVCGSTLGLSSTNSP